MVVPCSALMRRRMPKMSRTTSGASPKEGSGNGQHLLLAARQRAGLLGAALAQAGEVAEHALHIAAHVGTGSARGPGLRAQAQVVLGAELGEGAAPVGHMAHALARDALG